MEKKFDSNKFLLVISSLNLFFFTLYILNFDLPQTSLLLKFLFIFLFLSLFSVLLILLKLNILKNILNIQISIFFIIIFFLFIEILYLATPILIPKEISLWIDKDDNQQKVIDYLDKSPYLKFKPNKVVRSAFYRGFSDEFVYSWKTDKNGFKNLEKNLNKKKYKAILLGNSWAEGMGVKTEDTFASQLSNRNFLTYNLGVQGYSPSQQYGVLKTFEVKFNYDFIISTYVADTYLREKNFYDKKNPKKYTGGIGNIERFEREEIRQRAKFTTSAIWLMSKGFRNKLLNYFRSLREEKILYPFNRYSAEFRLLEKQISEDFFEKSYKDIYWEEALKNFKRINSFAKNNNKKMLFIYAPRRVNIYYEFATGKKLPNVTYNESNLLRQFCEKEGIIFLDLTSPLIEYTSNLKSNNKLPFLKVDGHLSYFGHKIYADEIIKTINLIEK